MSWPRITAEITEAGSVDLTIAGVHSSHPDRDAALAAVAAKARTLGRDLTVDATTEAESITLTVTPEGEWWNNANPSAIADLAQPSLPRPQSSAPTPAPAGDTGAVLARSARDSTGITQGQPSPKPQRRRAPLALVLIAVLLAAVAAGGFLLLTRDQGTPSTQPVSPQAAPVAPSPTVPALSTTPSPDALLDVRVRSPRPGVITATAFNAPRIALTIQRGRQERTAEGESVTLKPPKAGVWTWTATAPGRRQATGTVTVKPKPKTPPAGEPTDSPAPAEPTTPTYTPPPAYTPPPQTRQPAPKPRPKPKPRQPRGPIGVEPGIA